jgi:peptide-methionine (S)-S-oxide reductase
VLRTSVGYAGGDLKAHPDPTYRSVCGDGSIFNHTEVTLVEYDPRVLSLERLLEKFAGSSFPPCSRPRQYRTGIWFTSEEQGHAAREVAARHGVAHDLAIEPLERYFIAEDYHQNYFACARRR